MDQWAERRQTDSGTEGYRRLASWNSFRQFPRRRLSSHGRGRWFNPSSAHHLDQRLRAQMSSAALGQKDQQGWVYFAEVVGSGMSLIKIGWSADPAKRRKALLQQAPFDIRMVTGFQASPAEERALHKRFAGCRGRGEWFNRDEALTDFINETLSRNGPSPWRRGGRPSKAVPLPPVEHMEPPD